MATTYTLISSNVLTSSAVSVTFSSIPSTYTDLVLRYSVRTDQASLTRSTMYFRLNSDTATNYSNTLLNGYSTGTSSFANSSAAEMQIGQIDATTATSNTFASGEIYIPSYNDSTNHPLSVFNAQENNSASDVWINTTAGLWRNANGITSVTLKTSSGTIKFISDSSFYLYGIKNS